MPGPGFFQTDRGRLFRTRADRAWRRLAVVAFILAVSLPIAVLMGFRFVVTSSVPKGLWFVHGGKPVRGSYVLICLPAEVGEAGLKAGYISLGYCPGGVTSLMKRVVATQGDRVDVTVAGLVVNGKLIPGSRPLSRDSDGRAIVGRVAKSEAAVPIGEVWVLGDYYKSWDSRYYGALSASRIIGVGTPILTTPAGS